MNLFPVPGLIVFSFDSVHQNRKNRRGVYPFFSRFGSRVPFLRLIHFVIPAVHLPSSPLTPSSAATSYTARRENAIWPRRSLLCVCGGSADDHHINDCAFCRISSRTSPPLWSVRPWLFLTTSICLLKNVIITDLDAKVLPQDPLPPCARQPIARTG